MVGTFQILKKLWNYTTKFYRLSLTMLGQGMLGVDIKDMWAEIE
jgi:hypothetical protein